jgi:hypothetical protein
LICSINTVTMLSTTWRSLFAILAFTTAFVFAYRDYGAYERVLYYLAYRIDSETSADGLALEVGSGCSKAASFAGKPCDFSEFMQYITQPDSNHPVKVNGMVALPIISTLDAKGIPQVHETANALETQGLANGYNAQKL